MRQREEVAATAEKVFGGRAGAATAETVLGGRGGGGVHTGVYYAQTDRAEGGSTAAEASHWSQRPAAAPHWTTDARSAPHSQPTAAAAMYSGAVLSTGTAAAAATAAAAEMEAAATAAAAAGHGRGFEHRSALMAASSRQIDNTTVEWGERERTTRVAARGGDSAPCTLHFAPCNLNSKP